MELSQIIGQAMLFGTQEPLQEEERKRIHDKVVHIDG